jgi:hypothetical protein
VSRSVFTAIPQLRPINFVIVRIESNVQHSLGRLPIAAIGGREARCSGSRAEPSGNERGSARDDCIEGNRALLFILQGFDRPDSAEQFREDLN